MSAATDKGVLAVIGGASHTLRNAGLKYEPMIEASATVAELIEAAKDALTELVVEDHDGLMAQERLSVALVRCGAMP